MKNLVFLIPLFLLAQTAFAQQTSRYFAGDYKYTASPFTINANTAAGADSFQFNLFLRVR